MQQNLLKHVRLAVVCVCSLFVMLLFSACAGVAGGTGTGTTGTNGGTITGSVVSINTAAHSVTINVNGQQLTVGGLTDAQISALQTQIGKRYSVQVQSNGSNSYTINPGTDPTETDNATPEVNVTPETTTNNNDNTNNGVNEPGTISFIGKVQSYNAGTLAVSLPGNQSLSMSAVPGQTEFKNLTTPQVNQIVKVDALANSNGSFMASKVEATDAGDQQDTVKLNTVDFKGVTTQAVGSNGNLSFKVGNKSFSFTIGSTTQLKDFTSAQAIGANQSIKVEVLYNGTSSTVQKVESNNG